MRTVIPSSIPAGIIGSGSILLTATGPAYDVAIAGVPFCSAATAENPYVRESVPTQKQQFDSGQKAGERSLGDWWRRSQASFHGGGGLLYAEPDGPTDPTNDVRFYQSKNLDVWTPGQVQRLPDTTQSVAIGSAITGMVTATAGATSYTLIAFGTTLRSWNGAGTTDYTWGGAGTILSLATDGQRYYVADNTGIYSGPVDGSAGGALLWNNVTTKVKLAWVKERLMCAQNNKLYELVGVGPALPAVKYTHPNSGWTWTDFAAGPTAILVSGYSGIHSAILELVLDAQGATPVLTAGQTRHLPTGEIVYCLDAYVDSFVAIGTNKGLRIGTYSVYGAFQYGPRVFTSTLPVRALTGREGYLYCSGSQFIGGETCLIRVDLGMPTDQAGRFAYATDLICPTAQTGDLSWIAVGGNGRLQFAVDSYGLVTEGSGPGSVREAWLTTSRIRMATVEPKLFRRIQVRGSFAAPGTVSVTVTGSNGEVRVAMPPISSAADLDDLSALTAPLEWLSLRFDLNGSSLIDFRGYVLKANSAVKPRRLFQLPLKVTDFEMDKRNNKFGYLGYGIARLLQLEALEDARDEVRLEMFTELGVLARQCTIEQVSFRQVHQPGQVGSTSGVVVVTLKTV